MRRQFTSFKGNRHWNTRIRQNTRCFHFIKRYVDSLVGRKKEFNAFFLKYFPVLRININIQIKHKDNRINLLFFTNSNYGV